jgi:hypothetical protein
LTVDGLDLSFLVQSPDTDPDPVEHQFLAMGGVHLDHGFAMAFGRPVRLTESVRQPQHDVAVGVALRDAGPNSARR